MDLLRRVAPGLSDEGSKDDHLVVVVVRGGWGEGGSVQGQLGTQGEGTFYSCQGPSVDQSVTAAGLTYGRLLVPSGDREHGGQHPASIDPQWPPDVVGPPFSGPPELSGLEMVAQFAHLNLEWKQRTCATTVSPLLPCSALFLLFMIVQFAFSPCSPLK